MNRRRRAHGAVRLFGRLLVALLSVAAFVLVSIQFARIVNENVAMAHSLSSINHDIAALRARRRNDQRQLQRLADPEGAVPEIHERLRLVRPNETIIYVKPST